MDRKGLIGRAGANTSPAVVLLLGTIAVLLAVLIVVIALRGGSSPPSAGGSNPGGGPNPGGAAASPPKPQPVDTLHVQQTYVPGHTYRSHVKAVLNAKASDKDWGIVQETNFQYAAEAEVDRTFESNDGNVVVLTEDFRKSQCLAAFTRIDDVRIELGAPAQTLLDLAGDAMGLPPGWSPVAVQIVNGAMRSPQARAFPNRIAQDPGAKVKVFFDSLQGKKVRIRYANGQGVTGVEPIGCTLTAEEDKLIRAGSVISDAYVLPDPAAKAWEIDAANLLPIVDPSLRATLVGSVKVERRRDEGPADNPLARINLDGSSRVELHDMGEGSQTDARWVPTGSLWFSFHDHIVTRATLGGQFAVERHSTNHILFEARFATQPRYDVSYTCEDLTK